MDKKRIYHRATVFTDKGYYDLNPLHCGYEKCIANHVGYGMRDYYMIHFVESGRGSVSVGTASYDVAPGQMFVIRQGEDAVYRADKSDPWVYSWLCFNGRMAARLDELTSPVVTLSGESIDMLGRIRQRENINEDMAVAILHFVFADIFSGEKVRPRYVKYTVDRINTLYMQPITVAGIADELGLDRRYLSRLFRAEVGMSIKEYLVQTRMEKAKKLLASARSVSLTAELVGYTDVFNFSKMFKKYVGVSPRAYASANSVS